MFALSERMRRVCGTGGHAVVFCGISVKQEGTLESSLSENNYDLLYCVPLSNVLGCCFYGRAGGLERGEAAPWVPASPYILFVSADSDGRTKRRPVAELPLRHKENEALTNQTRLHGRCLQMRRGKREFRTSIVPRF